MTATAIGQRRRSAHPHVGGHLLGISAELRKLTVPAVAITLAATVSIAAVTTLLNAGTATFRSGARFSVLQADSLTGALRISALHAASLSGLLLATVLAVTGIAAEYESGIYGLLLLAEPRRRVLLCRKLVAGMLVMTAALALSTCVQRSCGFAIRWHYGHAAQTTGPSWEAALTSLGRSLMVQAVFLLAVIAVATVARSALGTAIGVMGPMLALAPVTRTSLAPWVPHYWVSGWMGFTRDEQFQTYLWNSASSKASAAPCGLMLAALAIAAAVTTAVATRGERLLRTTE